MASSTPFDTLAPDYDRAFSETPIGRWLRERTHAWMARQFAPGALVLELGCGTGEDALWLARRGVRVLATDASPAMLERARARTADEPNVTVAALDLNALDTLTPDWMGTVFTGVVPIQSPSPSGRGEKDVLEAKVSVDESAHQTPHEADFAGPFDGLLANFGALNCARDRRALAAWLAQRIRPGGRAAVAVMGPLCAWETAWHGLHGDLKTATRRWHGAAAFQPDEAAAALTLDYPSIRTLKREFAPYFRNTALRGLGVFLPPSDGFGVVENRPRLLRLLTALERGLAGNRIAALVADHTWIEFTRTNAEATR